MMLKALKGLALVGLTAAMALCCAVLWHVNEAAKEMGEVARAWQATAVNANLRVSDTSQNLNAVLIQWGLASDELRRAAIEQRQSLLRSDRQVQQLIVRANDLLKDTDSAVISLNQSQVQIANRASDAIEEIRPALQSSERMMDTASSAMQIAGNRLDDPHVQHMVAQADQAVTHINSSTAIVEGELRKWTEPVTKVKAVFKRLGEWTAQHLFNHLIP